MTSSSSSAATSAPGPAPTVVQIVTSAGPANDAPTRRPPGGALGTWASKLQDMGCPTFTLVLLIGASIALSTGALVYSQSSAATTCVAVWNEFSLDYTTWLEAYGLSNLAILGIGTVLLSVHGCSGTVCSSKLATGFAWISIVLKVGWYVVGACVYWKTVSGSCPNGGPIQSFGLGLFILDFVLFALAYCARKAQDMVP